jgi:hypothetical protein
MIVTQPCFNNGDVIILGWSTIKKSSELLKKKFINTEHDKKLAFCLILFEFIKIFLSRKSLVTPHEGTVLILLYFHGHVCLSEKIAFDFGNFY